MLNMSNYMLQYAKQYAKYATKWYANKQWRVHVLHILRIVICKICEYGKEYATVCKTQCKICKKKCKKIVQGSYSAYSMNHAGSMNHAERTAVPTWHTTLFGKSRTSVSNRCCRRPVPRDGMHAIDLGVIIRLILVMLRKFWVCWTNSKCGGVSC